MPRVKKCPTCEKDFIPKPLQKYCSPQCLPRTTTKRRKTKDTPTKIKKRSARAIDRDLLKQWSNDIKERAGWKCEYCGNSSGLNSHHIFSRRFKNIRYNLDAGICLCAKHHLFDSRMSAHKAPRAFFRWLEEYKGKDFVDVLEKLTS